MDRFVTKRQRVATAAAAAATAGGSDSKPPQEGQKEKVFPGHDISCCWLQQGVLPESVAIPTMEEWIQLMPAVKEKVRMYGKLTDMPRFSQNYGHSYTYSGVLHEAKPMPPCLEPLLEWVNNLPLQHAASVAGGRQEEEKKEAPATRGGFKGLLVNWYLDGKSYISEHADNEDELVPGSPVVSLSHGQERVFRIRPPKPKKNKKEPTASSSGTASKKRKAADRRPMRDIVMRNRTWLVMGGNFQKHFTHQVPKGSEASVMGMRVNVTARKYQ